MLFGTLIFIKKSGGDGSRFPVTNKSLKIGRSNDCIIRIQNPLISPEHCQLTVDDHGQAKIRNLSTTNPTVLNDQPLGNGEFVLHQGDVFKLGERYARWEYQPASKYYNQPSSSSQRLVAVVPPQERTPLGKKCGIGDFYKNMSRRHSGPIVPDLDLIIPGRGPPKKAMRLSMGPGKGTPNKTKVIGRHSLQLKRLAFSPQVKLRKSTNLESSGTPNSSSGNKTPLRRSSTWEVKTVTPEKGKSPPKVGTNRKSTPIKVPMTRLSNENLIKSTLKSASKIPNLLTITETSPTATATKIAANRSTHEEAEELNLSPKSPMKLAKTPTPKSIKLTSPRKSLSKSNKKKSFSRSMIMDGVQVLSNDSSATGTRGDSWDFSPSGKTTLRKSVLKKSVSQSDLEEIPSSDEKNTPKKEPGTPAGKKKLNLQPVVEMIQMEQKQDKKDSPKPEKQTPVKSDRKTMSDQSKSTPPSITKQSERLSRSRKSIPSGLSTTPKEKENVKSSPKAKTASPRKSPTVPANKTSPNRGTKREISAVASAERAAKKLKTIAPTKPDKNKKAALLVLGKASGKLKALQNTNVVIKQKIVKKAIKQSTKSRKRVNPVRKTSPKKETIQDNKITSPEASTSSRRHSTPISKTPTRESPKNIKTPVKTKTDTPGKRSSSSSVTSPVSNVDNLNSSVPSKASEVKSVTVSPNSGNTSTQYTSPVLYDATRRVSKRLNSPNFSSRPDFTELSPTALGLAPKYVVDVFKTPKPVHRRSSSLVTPKNKGTPPIIKSASTSKINRKSVRFLNKDLNDSSNSFGDMNATGGTTFDFDEIRTPNVTLDRFISPLSHQKTPKIQLKSPSSVTKKMGEKVQKSPKNDLTDVKGVRQLLKTPQPKKSPKNDLTDVKGVRQLLKTPQPKKSPKNDLTDVKGVRQLLKTPQPKKSPKNDLTDVKGVRQLLKTPQPKKSPKNDLTDVKGVRQLLKTPQPKKSPKNDLTDVKGVRQLLKTPQPRKSPKNDLTDVRGVKRLMASPKQQKSPKNDLTDVRGVKRLMEPLKPQKSPKNDLTDVRGVKKLMEPPKPQKSPKNDLTDVTGVKQLFASPRTRKSPLNDLTDVRGVKRVMEPLKQQKSPKNDLTDVRGVRRLMESPRLRKSPRNDLTDVAGLETMFKSPPNKIQCLRTLQSPLSKDVSGVRQLFSMDKENNLDVSFTGVAELFLSPKKSDTPGKRAAVETRVSDADKPVLRRTARSVTKSVREPSSKRTSRTTAAQSPIKSDAESPKVVRRATRNAVKATKTESEVTEVTEETTTSRSTRATRKQPVKRQVEVSESPAPIVKRTRKVTLAEDKPATPARSSTRTRKEPAKEDSPESKPSPIRTRRKSMARQSPKTVKRSTRAKASEPAKTNVTKETAVSPVKTRQRKAKEASSAEKKTKSSPVRTRRRAAK